MIKLEKIHHLAIICSDYEVSKRFYTEYLGLKVLSENYRPEREGWKLDLGIGDAYCIELFSFKNPPARVSRPEAAGLRHLAFQVSNIEESISGLRKNGIETEPVRTDAYTGKRFTFFSDPDGLPLELYES